MSIFGAKAKKAAKDFVYGKPEGERRLGDLYIGNTGLYKHREWRGVKNTLYAYSRWMETLYVMVKGIGAEPVGTVKGLFRYRWMQTYLTGIAWIDRGMEGLRDEALAASYTAYLAMFADSIRQFTAQFKADANLRGGKRNKYWYKTIAHDETLEGHLFYGLPGYEDILIQLVPVFLQPHVNKDVITHYIDVAESIGLPADVCSLPSGEAGVAIAGDFPDFSPVVLFSNMACDGSIATSILQEATFGKPMYAMPMPMRYDEPEVREFAAEEVKGAIAFLEEQLGVKYDWEAFLEGIENYNRLTRAELERWEVSAKTDSYPLNGVAQALFRLFYFSVGYRPIFEKASDEINRLMYRAVKNNKNTFPATRHRAIVWSCAPLFYSYLPAWLYNCWGINVVMNMDSMMGHNIMRTDTKEHALEDLADMFSRSPMRTHAVGGHKHIFELWQVIEQFNADMVIMYDQVTCKGMDGIHGVFEDEFRKRGVHAIWVPHDLLDYRTVTRPEVRKAVNDYMLTVMQEEPLDPSLVDFDDSMSW